MSDFFEPPPPPPPNPNPVPRVGNPERVQFRANDVFPSPAIYVAVDDYLYVSWFSELTASTILQVRARLLLPDGTLIIAALDLAPNAASGKITSGTLGLAEGWLIGVTCNTTGSTRANDAFAIVQLARYAGGNQVAQSVLVSGQLGLNQPLGWPGSPLTGMLQGRGLLTELFTSPPAAGAEWTYTVYNYHHVRIIGLHLTLVTSGTVANRTPAIVIGGAGNTYGFFPAASAQTAGQTVHYTWPASAAVNAAGIAQTICGGPAPILLGSGQTLATQTANLQAGDQWGSIAIWAEVWFSGATGEN